jgi:hypothetical protein
VFNGLIKRTCLATRVFITGETHAETKREIPTISLEEVAEIKQFFHLDKFFIFGHARSGTTLLVRLIRLHPDVHCNYQAHFFTRPPLLESLVANAEVGAWLSRRSNRWNHGGDLSPLVLRASADFIMERDAIKVGKTIVGDKSPSSLLDGEAVRLMQKVYPDGRLLYIVRDGRDAIISHRFQSFIDASQHLSKEDIDLRKAFENNPEPFLNGEQSIFTEKGFKRAVEGWNRNVTETDTIGKDLFGDNYHSMRYEDLLEHSFEIMCRLWTFLGAHLNYPGLEDTIKEELSQNPDADWQRQKAGDLIVPLKKGKQGSWRDLFTNDEKQVFKNVAGQTLIEWGYENGLDW